MINNTFPSNHPLVAHKLALLRNVDTQPKIFRELVREISMLLCYEATKDLETAQMDVQTPLAKMLGRTLQKGIALVPVLRAGLGMVEGVCEMIPGAEVWHIGLKRDERTLQPVQYYSNKPVETRVQLCIILDPMLATGGSTSATCKILKDWGVKRIKYIGLIAAPEGVARMQAEHADVPIHIGCIDERLNEKGYILPGLGDAGDRQFGT